MIDLKLVKQLIKIMHAEGITHLKYNGVELTCPSPNVSIKQQIMRVSPKEAAAINKKPSFTKDTAMDELDLLLFSHEKF